MLASEWKPVSNAEDVDLIAAARRQYAAYAEPDPPAFFDGPAGTQVPECVIEAVAGSFRTGSANTGGHFATSRRNDAMLAEAHAAAADFLNADRDDEVSFGANMTTVAMGVSRALARTWRPGDEIVLSKLDHEANIDPWRIAAEEKGVTVRWIDVRTEDCTLDVEQYRSLLSDRTRLVAVGVASNAVGTRNPVEKMCRLAKDAGAMTFVDAVHSAPHERTDVQAIGCDFLACSAYKFFGPHIGILYARRETTESVAPYKIRPAPETLPGRWMTGTQNFACIAGTRACIDYLANFGRTSPDQPRRPALDAAFERIERHEHAVFARLLRGLNDHPKVTVHGITDPDRHAERCPTLAFTYADIPAGELAKRLAEANVTSWSGHYYALTLFETLGLLPDGALRLGVLHYNDAADVDRALAAIPD